MPEQPQLVGGTISPEGAATSGGAPDVDLLSVSTIGATSTADRWWKFTAVSDASVNFDAMLSYPATGARTSLVPDITVSVYEAADLVTPIGTASSGVDPQQGSVSRGSVAVTVEAGVTYYIALTGGVDAYRILRVSDATPPGAWQTGPDAEYVQVIAPTGMTIAPVNFSGTYSSIVTRSNKRIDYGITPAFAGPAAYLFPAAWSCAWEGHLHPCYVETGGQLWNNPPDDPSWNGSGACVIVTVPPPPTSVGIDFATPTVAWENSTDSTGHAFGRHTGTGYRIFHSTLLADDPGPTTVDELPAPPPGATVEWEDSDDGSRVLSLEIAATDDGTGDGEVAFRRFGGGYGVDADGTWWVGEHPDGELLISGYDGSESWQPYTLDEGTISTVVGFTQYVEDFQVPPAPITASTLFGEARNPELAFRLTWEPRRYRWIYPPVVPPIIAGFPPLRIFGRSDGATHGARRVLGGGNTRQGGSRTLGSIL